MKNTAKIQNIWNPKLGLADENFELVMNLCCKQNKKNT